MPSPTSSPLRFPQVVLAAALLFCLHPVTAEVPKSLLPTFGTEGAEFTTKAQSNDVVHGWLPNGWSDNTEWAAVTATYNKLSDAPDKSAGAVRIKIDKIDEGFLQFTTYGGNQKYHKGTHYRVSGWTRSPDRLTLHLGIRQMGEPYEFYHEQEVSTETDWKPFEFTFTPAMDVSAFLMFMVKEPGTLDVASVALEEKP